MDPNPYKAPRAGIEPAARQPLPIGAAAKSGAWIGAIIAFGLFVAFGALIVVMAVGRSGAIQPGDIGSALAAMLAYTLTGSAYGAAIGALFQAIENAAIRRKSKKTPPAD